MKSILLLICIISTLGLEVPAAKIKGHLKTTKTTVCAGKDGVLVAMPGSCTGFFFCMDGNAIASSCGNFYHFNARLAICDHPDNAMCHHHQTSLAEVAENDADAMAVCAQAPEGHIFAKARSCTLFFVCRQRQAVRRVCPPHKHFNVQAKLCQDVHQAQCNWAAPLEMDPVTSTQSSLLVTKGSLRKPVDYSMNTISPAAICSAKKINATVPHPWDCGKFIYCLRHHPQVMACPKGLHFSKKKLRCEWPSIAECKTNA